MLASLVPGRFGLRHKECKASSLGMCRIQGISGPENNPATARDNHGLSVLEQLGRVGTQETRRKCA